MKPSALADSGGYRRNVFLVHLFMKTSVMFVTPQLDSHRLKIAAFPLK